MCVSFGDRWRNWSSERWIHLAKVTLSVAQLDVESRYVIPKVALLSTNQVGYIISGFALERTPDPEDGDGDGGEMSHPDMGSCYSLQSGWRKHPAQPVAALAAHLSHSPRHPLG